MYIYIYICIYNLRQYNVTTRRELSFRLQNINLLRWLGRRCLVLGLSYCDVRGLLRKVARCLNLALSVCVQSGGGQQFSAKSAAGEVVWSHAEVLLGGCVFRQRARPLQMGCGSNILIRPTQTITQWQPLLSFSFLVGSGEGGHSCSWNFLGGVMEYKKRFHTHRLHRNPGSIVLAIFIEKYKKKK